MVVDVKPQVPVVTNTNGVRRLIGRYNHAKAIKDLWTSTFEECYEFALPQRESFYTESIGRRRTDRIFDETAVVISSTFLPWYSASVITWSNNSSHSSQHFSENSLKDFIS